MKEKIDIPVVEIVDGEVTYNMGADMASADPIRYSRLIRQGKEKEAEQMWNQTGVRIVEVDEIHKIKDDE